MKKIFTKYPFYFLVPSAFGCIISFCQINSYGADKNHTNGLFYVLGFVLLAIAILALFVGFGKNKK